MYSIGNFVYGPCFLESCMWAMLLKEAHTNMHNACYIMRLHCASSWQKADHLAPIGKW